MQIPSGAAQVNWVFSVTGDSEEMLCTAGWSGALLSTDPVAVADFLFQTWEDTFLQRQSSDISLQRVDVVRGPTPNPLTFSSTLAPVSGFGTGGSPFVNTAVLVQKRTELGGRRGRGRMFIPCPDIAGDSSVAGIIASGELTAWQTAADTFLTTINDAEAPEPFGTLVLLHATGSSAATIITDLTVSERVATQRRRLRP